MMRSTGKYSDKKFTVKMCHVLFQIALEWLGQEVTVCVWTSNSKVAICSSFQSRASHVS